MGKAKTQKQEAIRYCPRCGCPTDIVQCTDGTVEECRDISCPWSKDNSTTVRLTLRNREQSVVMTEPIGNSEIDVMVRDVAANGGEYSFKTVKGKVQDVHYTEPTGNPEIYDYDPEYQFKRGGASGKA